MLSYKELKMRIREIGSKINVPEEMYPKINQVGDEFSETVIKKDLYYYYIFKIERGKIVKCIKCKTSDDLMYLIFFDITDEMAGLYEVENRVNNQDYRRIMFEKQLELMKCISIKYYQRLKMELEEVLKKYPYNDG